MTDKETRFFTLSNVEVRAANVDEPAVITGYAAVFNAISEDLGGFREVIRPGAFAQSLKNSDIRALWDHNSQYVLGRNRAGTLALDEDNHGLRVQIMPPDTVWANDLITSMQRGDINQMSFGFQAKEQDWERQDGESVRFLNRVDVFDVSIVTYPAYPQTSAEARNMAATLGQEADGAIESTADDAQKRRALAEVRKRAIEILKRKQR